MRRYEPILTASPGSRGMGMINLYNSVYSFWSTQSYPRFKFMQLMDSNFCPNSAVKHICTFCSLHRQHLQHINFFFRVTEFPPPDEHYFWNEDYISIEHEVYVGYSWSWKCYVQNSQLPIKSPILWKENSHGLSQVVCIQMLSIASSASFALPYSFLEPKEAIILWSWGS